MNKSEKESPWDWNEKMVFQTQEEVINSLLNNYGYTNVCVNKTFVNLFEAKGEEWISERLKHKGLLHEEERELLALIDDAEQIYANEAQEAIREFNLAKLNSNDAQEAIKEFNVAQLKYERNLNLANKLLARHQITIVNLELKNKLALQGYAWLKARLDAYDREYKKVESFLIYACENHEPCPC